MRIIGRRVVGTLVCAAAAVVATAGAVDQRPPDDGAATLGGYQEAVPRAPTAPLALAPTSTELRRPLLDRLLRRTVTLAMGGDLLWHNTVWQSAAADQARTGRGTRFDFDPMLAAVRPWFASADVAVCHEEVPLAVPGQQLSSYPVFAAPPQVAPWAGRYGFDACTTASNHSLDGGFAGLARTAALFERHGVRHVGTFRSRAERRRPVILTTDAGVRVALVAGTFGLNGFPLPEGKPWAVSMWDADNLLAQAHRARRAGADIVVVHLHGGTEYDHAPNADQTALVDRLTRSADVDLVLGDHAHVVQPITRVHGTWVVYGMGNLVGQSETDRPSAYQGVAVRFTFGESRHGRFEVRRAAYLPLTWGVFSSATPIRVRPAPGAVRRQIRTDVHALGRTAGLIER